MVSNVCIPHVHAQAVLNLGLNDYVVTTFFLGRCMQTIMVYFFHPYELFAEYILFKCHKHIVKSLI